MSRTGFWVLWSAAYVLLWALLAWWPHPNAQ